MKFILSSSLCVINVNLPENMIGVIYRGNQMFHLITQAWSLFVKMESSKKDVLNYFFLNEQKKTTLWELWNKITQNLFIYCSLIHWWILVL